MLGFNFKKEIKMKKYILINLFFLVALTACNDDILDTVPETSIPEEVAYSTPGKILAQTNNFVNNVWSVCFTAINASNILISKLNGTTVVEQSLAKNYIAEAKFIRAF